MQRRKKVGGILDRRFGEDDPTMTPEEKAMERFVTEKQRGGKRSSMFALEDDFDSGESLTHLGQSLSFVRSSQVDDFDESGLALSEDGDDDGRPRKRQRSSVTEVQVERRSPVPEEDEDPAGRPKTKQEVMKEVIAKSKFHKYERQKAKEDDEDLRAELDQGLSSIYSLLRGTPQQTQSPQVVNITAPEMQMNPDRAALLNGKDRAQADKEYDERLRQMAFDARSKPTVRLKTEEERAEDEAKRLKELEERRLARMRGDDVDADVKLLGEEADELADGRSDEGNDGLVGFGKSIGVKPPNGPLDVEDEDDFILDNSLIASDSEVGSISEADFHEDEEALRSNVGIGHEEEEKEEEDDFVQGLLSNEDFKRDGLPLSNTSPRRSKDDRASSELAYAYPCPQSHDELLHITKGSSPQNLPTIVQRIRALYHPKLSPDNKAKLGVFSAVLVDHIAYLTNQPDHPTFDVLETLSRHLHSLAKSFPDEVSNAFRAHLKSIEARKGCTFNAGDLVILTAVATIFPTSDLFHEVVTPSLLCMTKYLWTSVPKDLSEMVKGTYVATLCLRYQRLSKRYVPEVFNYTIHMLARLAPARRRLSFGNFPVRKTLGSDLRIEFEIPVNYRARKMQFWDIEHVSGKDDHADECLKIALLDTNVALLDTMADLWSGLSAFIEIVGAFQATLMHLSSLRCSSKLPHPSNEQIRTTLMKIDRLAKTALHERRPLRLHEHRPIAIREADPVFEEDYKPGKRYDPDHDRAEMSKLKAEHKRERKGALRELRKDASFIARESLREKKEKDAEYEKKYKRLVAEIQGEEGKEANAYEREKRARKGRK